MTKAATSTTRSYEMLTPPQPKPQRGCVARWCGICKKQARDPSHEGDWLVQGDSFYDRKTVEVCMKTGDAYPESGSVKETRYDICDDCFTSVLGPFLEEKGCGPVVHEYDY